jgi:hypothetical protein
VPRRPVDVPLFARDPANVQDVVEPTELIRSGGYLPNQRPAAPHQNWLHRQAGDWIDFLRGPGTSNWRRRSFSIGSTLLGVATDNVTTLGGTPTPGPIRRILSIQSLDATAALWASERGERWKNIADGDAIEASGPTCVAFTGSRWIVGTSVDGKLYWSWPSGGLLGAAAIDEDAAWAAATIPAGLGQIVALAYDGDETIVAITADAILYSTDNGGVYTEATYAGDPITGAFTSVVFDGTAWIAITLDGEVVRTTVPSSDWTRDDDTLPSGDWRLRTDTFTVVAFEVNGSGFDLYLSTDSGVSFSALTLPSAENDSFSALIDLQFLDSQWWLVQSKLPGLSASNDVRDPLAWVPLTFPVYSDAAPAKTITIAEGAFSLFFSSLSSSYVLQSIRAADTSPGPWTPYNAPTALHDAAYLRGNLVADTTPIDGDVIAWDDSADEYQPTRNSAGYRQTAISTVQLVTDEVIGVTSVAAARAITLKDPATLGVTAGRYRRLTVVNESGATTNPITITPASGTVSGAANKQITTAYGAIVFITNGVTWFVESVVT